MLGKDAHLPKVEAMSPKEIAKVREQAGVSQAVACRLHECRYQHRQPMGTRRTHADRCGALKLLHVVKREGIDVLR